MWYDLLKVIAWLLLLIAIFRLFIRFKASQSFNLTARYVSVILATLFLVFTIDVIQIVTKNELLNIIGTVTDKAIAPLVLITLLGSRLSSKVIQKRDAEYFSSKVLNASQILSYVYNLESNSFVFLAGREVKNQQKKSSVKGVEADRAIQRYFSAERLDKIRIHFNMIKVGSINKFPLTHDFSAPGIDNKMRHFRIFENIYSKNNKGEILEIVGVVHDITDRIVAEEELLQHNSELEILVNKRTCQLKKTNENLLNVNEQLSKTNKRLEQLFNTTHSQSRHIETLNTELVLKNESLTSANKELIVNQEKLTKTLKALQEMQDQLVQSEKLTSLGVLVAGIAHEITNPVNYIGNSLIGLNKALRGIESFASELKQYINDTEEEQSSENCLKLIEKNNLIHNLNTFSVLSGHIKTGIEKIQKIVKSLRQYTHTGKENFDYCNINEIIETVLTMLQHEYKHKINVVWKKEKLPPIQCLEGKINQVVMNILSNAIHAIPDNGDIFIIAELNPDNESIIISIRDTGIGIPEEIRNKIFDPFFTTKKSNKGMGLGLSICYDIVKFHGGTIHVSSNKNKGTEFNIVLPIQQTTKN